MSRYLTKRDRVLFFVAIVSIIIFVILSTFYWYMYFLDFTSDGIISNGLDKSDKIKIVDAKSIESNISTISGYEFSVQNSGLSTRTYRLIIKDVDPTKANDGCTDEMTLSKREIFYSLEKNGSMIRDGLLSTIKGTLTEGTINIDTKDDYVFKVWVNDVESVKHYHYEIVLEVR